MSRSLFGSIKDSINRKLSSSGEPFDPESVENQRDSRSEARRSAYMSSKSSAPNEVPPPPYTVTPDPATTGGLSVNAPITSRSPAPSLASVTNDDDKYAFLTTFDTIFLVDDSGSMAGASWKEVGNVLQAITPICTSHDKDGIDVYFLNHRSTRRNPSDKAEGGYYNITNPDEVREIFTHVKPGRATPTGTRLNHLLKPYIASLGRVRDMETIKPVNIIVITDGSPTDDPESIIVQHAKKLDKLEAPPYQVGIQFFQVGQDPQARAALEELDDGLTEQGVRDMVDTVSWDDKTPSRQRTLTADGVLKVVLGAVVRRLDRKSTTNHGRSRT